MIRDNSRRISGQRKPNISVSSFPFVFLTKRDKTEDCNTTLIGVNTKAANISRNLRVIRSCLTPTKPFSYVHEIVDLSGITEVLNSVDCDRLC